LNGNEGIFGGGHAESHARHLAVEAKVKARMNLLFYLGNETKDFQ
jgi:hypothetical protein